MSFISDQISGLNPQQRAVALHDGHCLAIAAPGSGKTKTLAVKASFLLSRGMTVVAVTFTRDAALELRERILALAGDKALPNLLVGTFHSIDLAMAFPTKSKSQMGVNILRRGFSKIGRPWVLVNEGSRRGYVMRAIEHAELSLTIEEATAIIEGIKSEQKLPETQQQAELAKMYQEILSRHGVIDFQDILLETNRCLDAGIISPLQCDYMLLDEYQDTDLPQFLWTMHHKEKTILTAVGDDDQSIYGFRRAMGYGGMMDFAKKLSAETIVLGTNYRSHAEVLEPAAKLIAFNKDRMPKALVAFKGKGGTACWERYGSRQLEAEACCEMARKALAAGRSFGVLARTNKRLDDMEAQCIKHQVPYTRAEGGSLLQSPEMAVFVAALSSLVGMDHRDADTLLAWCRVSENELKALRSTFGQNILSPHKRGALSEVTLLPDAKKSYSQICRRFLEWSQMLKVGATIYVMDKMLELLCSHTDDKRSKATLEIICQAFIKPKDAGLGAHLDGLSFMRSHVQSIKDLIAAKPSKDKKVEGNPVVLLTAHGSKGLEYDEVWIVGAEDGCFPDESASIQEERRLFYVAMTRARKTLLISASGKAPISQFIQEAGVERLPEDSLAS